MPEAGRLTIPDYLRVSWGTALWETNNKVLGKLGQVGIVQMTRWRQ